MKQTLKFFLFALLSKEKPAPPAHTFTFRLTDEPGDEVSGTSGEIVWE